MSAKPFRKPYVQPASNDPGIDQGRRQNYRQMDGSGIVWGTVYGLALWAILALVWAMLK